jgi:hypothetical protein
MKKITATELEILKHLQNIQFSELNFRRTREFMVFQWSSSIFAAIIGIPKLVLGSPKT